MSSEQAGSQRGAEPELDLLDRALYLSAAAGIALGLILYGLGWVASPFSLSVLLAIPPLMVVWLRADERRKRLEAERVREQRLEVASRVFRALDRSQLREAQAWFYHYLSRSENAAFADKAAGVPAEADEAAWIAIARRIELTGFADSRKEESEP